jgi:hypothetical protein
MPDAVYLVPQVNAFVSERGGTGGVGSRRVMDERATPRRRCRGRRLRTGRRPQARAEPIVK